MTRRHSAVLAVCLSTPLLLRQRSHPGHHRPPLRGVVSGGPKLGAARRPAAGAHLRGHQRRASLPGQRSGDLGTGVRHRRGRHAARRGTHRGHPGLRVSGPEPREPSQRPLSGSGPAQSLRDLPPERWAYRQAAARPGGRTAVEPEAGESLQPAPDGATSIPPGGRSSRSCSIRRFRRWPCRPIPGT